MAGVARCSAFYSRCEPRRRDHALRPFRFADTRRCLPPPASRSVDVVFSENAIICNLNLHGKMRGKDPELHFQIMKDSNYSVANVGISANMW